MRLKVLAATVGMLMIGSVTNSVAQTAIKVSLSEIPASVAYIEPNPEGAEVSETGISKWSDPKQQIVWYGRFAKAGRLSVSLNLKMPETKLSSLRLTIEKQPVLLTVKKINSDEISADFGNFNITKPSYVRIVLQGVSKVGKTFGSIVGLSLTGEAMEGAHFNVLKPQRGSPSVHLSYPLSSDTKAAWFYNEVTAKTDPTASYYMACGWHRGYFGMQVNSPTERRVIFSVWDSGSEAKDRNKVAEDNRVKLLAKGKGVFTDGFGNEGTGGHSHLVYPWITGKTYRFLVSAEPVGDKTIYTGYFYFPEKQAWGLIARFQSPKDGGYMRGLYSFDEDFWGANGQNARLAEFGNQWVKTAGGEWIELTKATFTHTGLDRKTGQLFRYDYDAGAIGNRFYLRGGGYKDGSVKYKDSIERLAVGKHPEIANLQAK